MAGFLTSSSVSLDNGSNIVNVTGSVDCSFVVSGTAVYINDMLMEGVSGTASDPSGNSTITLRNIYTGTSIVGGELVAFNTIEGLRDAIQRARDLSIQFQDGTTQIGEIDSTLYTFLTALTPTETVSLDAGTFDIEPYEFLRGRVLGVETQLSKWEKGLYPEWISDAGSGTPFPYPVGVIVNHAGQDWISNVTENQEEPGVGNKWSVYFLAKFEQYGTTATLAAGKHPEGSYVIVKDRAFGLFLVQSGGAEDGKGILDAGDGNTAAWQVNPSNVNPQECGFVVNTSEDMQPYLQYAADATPEGGVFKMPDIDGIAIIDIPNNGEVIRPAIHFDKTVTAIGSKKCQLKIKDFCTGWTTSAIDTQLWAIISTKSNSEITGFNIDCNGAHHYEVDGSGFKWWEKGPTNKRPPNGIGIICKFGESNNINSIAHNNHIIDCLGGIAAAGGMGGDLYNAGIFDQSLTSGLVSNAEIYENTIEFSRGNSTYVISGAINCTQRNNTSLNSMYHPARIYAGCDNCTIVNNEGVNDYRVIKSRYNETDLGYWRTNKIGDVSYGIRRTGFRIGSALAASSGDSNIANCSIDSNTLRLTGHITAADILSTVEMQYGADLLLSPKNNTIINNRFYGGHITGVGQYFDNLVSGDNQGSYSEGNKSFDLQGQIIWSNGNGVVQTRNYGRNCGQLTDQVRWTGDNCVITDNEIYAGPSTDLNIIPFRQLGGADNFVTDNYLDKPEQYTQPLHTAVGSVIGSNVRGVIPTLLNGWANEDAASANWLTFNKNKAGEVTITGLLSGIGRTTALVAMLPVSMRPRNTRYTVVFQRSTGTVPALTQYVAFVSSDGSFNIVVTGTLPDKVAVNFSFNVNPA